MYILQIVVLSYNTECVYALNNSLNDDNKNINNVSSIIKSNLNDFSIKFIYRRR
jgi:hypothetical protein